MDHAPMTLELRPLYEGAYTQIRLDGPVVTTPSSRDLRRLQSRRRGGCTPALSPEPHSEYRQLQPSRLPPDDQPGGLPQRRHRHRTPLPGTPAGRVPGQVQAHPLQLGRIHPARHRVVPPESRSQDVRIHQVSSSVDTLHSPMLSNGASPWTLGGHLRTCARDHWATDSGDRMSSAGRSGRCWFRWSAVGLIDRWTVGARVPAELLARGSPSLLDDPG
jgi:hypothetical protein